MSDLTKKEIEELKLQAELEVEEELKAEAKAELLKEEKERIKKEKTAAKEAVKTPKKGTRMVLINLGKHTDRILVDGRIYLHGREYPLTPAQEASILDMAFRTHLHQAELKGKGFLKDFYGKRQANASI